MYLILVTSRIYNNSIMYVEPTTLYCVRFRNKNRNTPNTIEYIIYRLCGGVKHQISINPSEFVI